MSEHASAAVAQQLLATQQRAHELEQRVHALTAENVALKADLYRLQQHRPPETDAELQAMWKGIG